jgi:DNA-binding NarL/FixJ family response regulator
MPDDLTRLTLTRRPTAAQPLMGLTILAVEDSRFACEALRLLAMRSGARLRRADCLASARRHLAVYRPSVALVDLGLPDGCGLELIGGTVARPIVLAISGDAARRDEAMQAGAQGFLDKPVASLGAFQEAILAHLPGEARPPGLRALESGEVRPDTFALKDDLEHAAEGLAAGTLDDGYAAQFVASVARAARDAPLAEAAQRLAATRAEGGCAKVARGQLARAVQERLSERRAI